MLGIHDGSSDTNYSNYFDVYLRIVQRIIKELDETRSDAEGTS